MPNNIYELLLVASGQADDLLRMYGARDDTENVERCVQLIDAIDYARDLLTMIGGDE